MKRLRLPLLGSETLIYAARLPSFTCVLRCHTSSPKGKDRNLISSNSVMGACFPAYQLANPNVHRLLTQVQLPTPALLKRIYLIFIWQELSQRAPILIFNPLLDIVYIVGGQWGVQYFCLCQKITSKHIAFRICFYPCADLFTM